MSGARPHPGRQDRPDRPGRRARGGRVRTERVRTERGAVTAELTMVLPVLVAVTIGLVWLLSVGAAQVRAVDAAREAARVAARGDDVAAAVGAGQRVAPTGSEVTVTVGGEQVRARVSASVRGPGGLFAFLPAVTVEAQAVAVAEEGG